MLASHVESSVWLAPTRPSAARLLKSDAAYAVTVAFLLAVAVLRVAYFAFTRRRALCF